MESFGLLLTSLAFAICSKTAISSSITEISSMFEWTNSFNTNQFFLSGIGKQIGHKEERFLLALAQNVETSVVADNKIDDNFDQFMQLRNSSESLWLIFSPNTTSMELRLAKIMDHISKPNIWNPKVFFVVPETFVNESAIHANFLSNPLIQNLTITSDIYFICKLENRRNSSVWEFYNIGDKIILQEINLAENGKIDMSFIRYRKLRRRQDFQGTIIRATAVSEDDGYFEEANFKIGTHNETLEFETGTTVAMLRSLSLDLNFSIVPRIGSYPTQYGNDSMDVDHQLLNGLTDIVISELYVTNNTARLMSFLQPTYSERIFGYFATPPPNSVRDIFYTSFSWDMWVALCSTWIVLTILLVIFPKVKQNVNRLSDFDQNRRSDTSIAEESFLWGFGAICQQGYYIEPRSISIRIIFIIGYFLGSFCFVVFSAAIVSTLSVKFEIIRTFKDLVQNQYSFLGTQESIGYDYLKGLLEDFGRNVMDGEELYKGENETINLITTSKCAAVTNSDIFQSVRRVLNLSDSSMCEIFSSVKVERHKVRYSMLVPKHSPYLEFFNWRIIAMVESGIIHRLGLQYKRAVNVRCLDTGKLVTPPLGSNDIFTAYLIFLSGYLMSIFCLCLEYLHVVYLRLKNHCLGSIVFL